MSDKLTNRQINFVAHYLTCWNASEAARRAGYSQKTAAIIGFENLRKPNIKALIDARMSDYAMSSNEVLARLSQMASANLVDVLDDEEEFDYRIAKERGLTHLIKKIKRRSFTDKDGNTTRETEIELYDAQAALVQMGKHHKLFASVIQVETWRDKVIDGLRKGVINPDEVLKEFGSDLATELFVAAGIPVGQS